MNKSELIDAIADKLEMETHQAASVLKTILETMTNALVRGESIRLRGFGSFDVREYGPYEGWNPKTLDRVHVKPKKAPHFKVGKDLRLKVNGE